RRARRALSARRREHMIALTNRLDAAVVLHLFHARALHVALPILLLARYGKPDEPVRVVPKISQATLAEMVGTTRSRVNFFMNKFKRLGFIEYTAELPLKINNSLLSVVLRD